jgi:TonB family protein
MNRSGIKRPPLLRVAALTFVLAGGVGHGARAQTAAPTPTPLPSAVLDATACPAAVLRVLPLDTPGSNVAQNVAVTFQAFAESAGRLSGIVTVFSKDTRFDVPFNNAVAVAALASGLPDQVPIVIHFPSAIEVDGAYLSAIAGADGGACGFGNIARAQVNFAELTASDTLVRERARPVVPIAAVNAAPDPVACKAPDEEPAMTVAVMPELPQVAKMRGDTGRVVVDVALAADGRVLDTWIWSSSGAPLLDDAALKAPPKGRFTAERFRCKPVFGVYPFATDFKASPLQ